MRCQYMRYTILSKGDSKSNTLKHKMMNQMNSFHMIEDTENPEIVISVGGDGTLLQAFHQYSHMLSNVAFVGVHTGHLGFYADWLPHEVEKLIDEIHHSEFQAIQIAEIASINNRLFRTVGSPLVLPKHHTCLITPVNHNTIRTTIDHVSLKHKNVSDIQFRVANEKVRFARFRPFPFWKRVHDSFIESEDD